METRIVRAYEEKGSQLVSTAEAILITDQVTRELATEFATEARRMIKVIENEFKPDIEKAHTLHKDLLARMNKLTEPFKKARIIVDMEISRDFLERDRVRREEERVARANADADRREQEAMLTREAEAFIEDGDLESAEDILDTEVVTAPIVPVAPTQQTTQTAAGSATVKRDIEVIVQDVRTILLAVINNRLPETIIQIDVGAAKRYAKASGRYDLPGFVIRETAVVSGRTR